MNITKKTQFKTIQKEYPDAIRVSINGWATADAIKKSMYGDRPAKLLQKRERDRGVTYVFSKAAAEAELAAGGKIEKNG